MHSLARAVKSRLNAHATPQCCRQKTEEGLSHRDQRAFSICAKKDNRVERRANGDVGGENESGEVEFVEVSQVAIFLYTGKTIFESRVFLINCFHHQILYFHI